MYGTDGRQKIDEFRPDHLSGYENSRPARIGNVAYQQLQLDIYGVMMDSIYLANKYGDAISSQVGVMSSASCIGWGKTGSDPMREMGSPRWCERLSTLASDVLGSFRPCFAPGGETFPVGPARRMAALPR